MRLDILGLTILAGVAFSLAFTHLLIYIRRRQLDYTPSFALFCIVVGLYDLLSAALYASGSAVEGVYWQRLQLIVLSVGAVALPWFVADYVRQRSRRGVFLFILAYLLVSAAIAYDPGEWLYRHEPQIKHVMLPFGAVVYHEMSPGPLWYIQSLVGAAVFGYVFVMSLRLYRRGERRRARPLLLAVAMLFVGVVNDIAVASGVYHFVYILEYCFFALVFVMGSALLRGVLRTAEIETALHESESRYRGFVEGTSDFVAQLDRHGLFTFVNHALAQTLGRAASECIGRPALDLFPAEEHDALRTTFDNWLRDKVTQATIEQRLVPPQGEPLVVLWTMTANSDDDGEILALNCYGRDISSRKRAEEQQLARLDRLQVQQAVIVHLATSEDVARGAIDEVARAVAAASVEAMDVARVSVWRLDEDAATLTSLTAFERTLGRFVDQGALDVSRCQRLLRSLRLDRAIPAMDAHNDPRTLELAENYLDPQKITACLQAPIRVSGRLFGLLSYETRSETRAWTDDEIGFACDVADQLAQTALNAERRRVEGERQLLAGAIEQAAEMVVITDSAGAIQYVNPAFERITGYSRGESLGRNPRLLKSGRQSDALYRDLWRMISNGRTWRGRFTNRKKDGAFYLEEAVISPVIDPSGRITHYVSVKRDITDEVQRNDQLHHALKMEAVGQLAGGVAHDFNNLLTPILGYTELLLMNLPSGDSSRPPLIEIHKAAENARDLTQQLLAFGRKQLIEIRVLDPGEIVARFAKILRRTIREDIEIVLRLAPARGHIRADPTQIEQMLMNLAVNAQDAMPQGGVMTIETDSVFLDESYARVHLGVPPGPYIVLAVSDVGIGMEADTIEHIFEPFFTTKEKGKGTGLGLATVYGIVKQHNGEIHVQSTPGQGATFRIYLPRVEQPADAIAMAPLATSRHGVETIVVVEDNRMVRELTARILREHGHTVIEAAGADECLSMLADHGGVVHLMVADVVMPGMNGKELYLKLLEKRPSLRVLFMSGYTDDVIDHHGVLEKGTHFIQKPYTVQGLMRKVHDALAGLALEDVNHA